MVATKQRAAPAAPKPRRPRPPTNNTLLLDMYERLAVVQNDVRTLLNDRIEADHDRKESNARLESVAREQALIKQDVDRIVPIVRRLEEKANASDGALLKQEVERLTPIVNRLERRADSGEGAKGLGRRLVDAILALIAGVGGAVLTMYTRSHS